MAANFIQKIQKTAPRYGDYFGATVKFSYYGSTMISTATAFDIVDYNIPTVSVYTFIDGAYVYHSDLPLPPDLGLSDHSCTYAQINDAGTVIMVSASNYINVPSTVGPNGGIWVFHLSDGVWSLVNTITAVPPNNTYVHENDKFGFFFDLSGDFKTMIASAPFDDSADDTSGTVYIMETTDDWLTYTVKAELENVIENKTFNYFGYNCVVSGDGLCAYSGVYDTVTLKSYVLAYEKIGGVWTYIDTIQTLDAVQGIHFGNALSSDVEEYGGVSIATDQSGSTVVIGDYGTSSNSGKFYVFKKSGSSFTQIYSELADTASSFMGYSVAISRLGNTIIVGAQGEEVGGYFAQGATYVYNLDGLGVTFREKISAPYLFNYSYGSFKIGMSPDGNYIGSGSIQDDSEVGPELLVGSVNVWTNARPPGTRTRKYAIINGKLNIQ